MGKLARLLIPRKTQNPVKQPDYGTDMRAIEAWAQNVGGIIEIVAGSNVTVTDGFGPVVTIAATGGGGGYASLTGPGQTTSPGALTQDGDFTVDGFTTLNGSFLASAPSGNEEIVAGTGTTLASIVVNGASGVFDPGTVSMQGSGGSSATPPRIQFAFTLGVPSFTVTNVTFDFTATGHIYFNGGGGSWTLVA